MSRRDDAARQAYYWALVAGDMRTATKDYEQARTLSNTTRDPLTEWQTWLLTHFDTATDQQRAIDLANMWTNVAEVQPTESTSAAAG